MNERMIWLVRIIAVFVFLLLAYLMMSLHAKLQRLQGDEPRTKHELQIADDPIADRGSRIAD